MASASGVVNNYQEELPPEFYDKYPDVAGFYHFLDFKTDSILTKTKFINVSIEGKNKKIYVMDCPPGLHFSCKVNACVCPDSPDACNCKAKDQQ